MGFVKRRASTKAKANIEDFASVKSQFLFDTKTIVEMEEIPHDNWDQTGIYYITFQLVHGLWKKRGRNEWS